MTLDIKNSFYVTVFSAVLLCVLVWGFTGCDKKGEASALPSGSLSAADSSVNRESGVSDEAYEIGELGGPSFSSLIKAGSMSLRYATQFSVDDYMLEAVALEAPAGRSDGGSPEGTGRIAGAGGSSGGASPIYKLVNIADTDKFLLVPEGFPVPADIPPDIKPLLLPLDGVYVVASAAMDLINETGSLDKVLFSGTKAKDWSIPAVSAAMENGKIAYAGKYSAPDYELLTANGCDFAIENTMIYHKPEVKEKLEELGIPVLVEYSFYEPHPLGRLEWIKLYGLLFGSEERAVSYYDDQLRRIEPIMEKKPSGKSVAFFYVNNNGAVNVRKPNDYVVKMISLSGGRYALEDLLVEEENSLSTMNMMMEDFYVSCVNSDILIYNGTIDSEFSSIEDLFAKSELFRDFAAVKNKKVYFVSKDFYQQTTGIADF
nr:ABC transporter substrate-binding protein [Treponemataceae bacterium]